MQFSPPNFSVGSLFLRDGELLEVCICWILYSTRGSIRSLARDLFSSKIKVDGFFFACYLLKDSFFFCCL
jgi:small basic protein